MGRREEGKWEGRVTMCEREIGKEEGSCVGKEGKMEGVRETKGKKRELETGRKPRWMGRKDTAKWTGGRQIKGRECGKWKGEREVERRDRWERNTKTN